ncbi:hypothetical protein DF115_26935 [Burkholderia stagnalis]|nr:hypothetical protein DF115_26935 [Burkholderia stagnalis]
MVMRMLAIVCPGLAGLRAMVMRMLAIVCPGLAGLRAMVMRMLVIVCPGLAGLRAMVMRMLVIVHVRMAGSGPATFRMHVIMVVGAGVRLRRLHCGRVAMRRPAGLRHRGGDTSRVHLARIGATCAVAAGRAGSFAVGTLGVGHQNLLDSLTV